MFKCEAATFASAFCVTDVWAMRAPPTCSLPGEPTATTLTAAAFLGTVGATSSTCARDERPPVRAPMGDPSGELGRRGDVGRLGGSLPAGVPATVAGTDMPSRQPVTTVGGRPSPPACCCCCCCCCCWTCRFVSAQALLRGVAVPRRGRPPATLTAAAWPLPATVLLALTGREVAPPPPCTFAYACVPPPLPPGALPALPTSAVGWVRGEVTEPTARSDVSGEQLPCATVPPLSMGAGPSNSCGAAVRLPFNARGEVSNTRRGDGRWTLAEAGRSVSLPCPTAPPSAGAPSVWTTTVCPSAKTAPHLCCHWRKARPSVLSKAFSLGPRSPLSVSVRCPRS